MSTKLEPQQPNLLEVLGVAEREDSIANLLRYCFLNSAPFRAAFLRALEIDAPVDGWDAYTRMHVKDFGTPDLVLWRTDPDELVIIENKLDAGEGQGQTARYADPACVARVRSQAGLDTDARVHLRFLTLFDDDPGSTAFRRVPYNSLLKREAPLGTENPLANQLAAALFELLTDFYAQAELDLDAPLLPQLGRSHSGRPDGGFLAFRSFVRGLHLPGDVRREREYRRKESGRQYHGVAIYRPSWRSVEIEKHGGRWALPTGHRHVHLQVRYDVLSPRVRLNVHYETYPYHSKRELEQRVPAEQYAAYTRRRESFIARFARLRGKEFRMAGYRNQLATANLSFENVTVREATRMVEEHIARATEVIDEAVRAEFGVPLNPES